MEFTSQRMVGRGQRRWRNATRIGVVISIATPGDAHHLPVLLEEILAALNVRSDGIYIDATYGRGGHSAAILSRLGRDGRLVAIDQDPQAVAAGQIKFSHDRRFSIIRGRFSMLEHYVENLGLPGQVNGIVLDLGVSSPQLDDAQRGFSFRREGPLDMRMDPDSAVSAAQWINEVTESTLTLVLRSGEERFARRIARAIIAARPLHTTTELARIVAQAVPTREPGKDPATRTFQAIRMHINQELSELEAVLPQTLRALTSGGRLTVISFHSLEDRVVKQFMRREEKGDPYPSDLPIQAKMLTPHLRTIGKAVRPTDAEVEQNPRARSAILRIAERVVSGYA